MDQYHFDDAIEWIQIFIKEQELSRSKGSYMEQITMGSKITMLYFILNQFQKLNGTKKPSAATDGSE